MPKDCYRILCLDGGGVRGVMTATWLVHLERRLGAPLHKNFDLIAGTSTGALIACGLASGMTALDLKDLYEKRGEEIFPNSSSPFASLRQMVIGPKYDGKGLARVLRETLVNAKGRPRHFGDFATNTLLFTYDIIRGELRVIKSYKETHKNLEVWRLCAASASAPTFFPPHEMTLDGEKCALVDGGVAANNPTACAIAEGMRLNRRQDGKELSGAAQEIGKLLVASFGAGDSMRGLNHERARRWSALQWARPLVDLLFDGATDSVDYVAQQLLEKKRYFRFQTEAYDRLSALDRADNIPELITTAHAYITNGEGKKTMDRLVTALGAKPPRD